MKSIARYVIILAMFVAACDENSNTNCDSTTIAVLANTSPTSNASPTGTISITSPIGSEYTYRLNNGTYQSNPTFSNLAAGTYNITAKNAAGCTGITSITISTYDCSSTPISVTANTTYSSASTPNGSITVTNPTGSNYTYSLNGGIYQSNPVFNGLAAGSYTVTAKDQNGCNGSSVFDVENCGAANGVIGTDTGSHKVYINSIYGIFPDLKDTLNVSFPSSNLLTMYSSLLRKNIFGTLETESCNNYVFDSIIYGPGDTMRINSTTLGLVKIYNLRAGGNATINGFNITTSIKIKKANSNLSILPSISNMEFKGSFKKY